MREDQRHMIQYEDEQAGDKDHQAGQCCGRVFNNLEERVAPSVGLMDR